MTAERFGLLLFVGVALGLMAGPFLADWNSSHVFNPDWPPHARLHTAMADFLTAGCGGVGLWLILRDGRRLALAAVLVMLPPAALLLAGLAPGAQFHNPAIPFSSFEILGIGFSLNIVLCTLALVATGLAVWLMHPGFGRRQH